MSELCLGTLLGRRPRWRGRFFGLFAGLAGTLALSVTGQVGGLTTGATLDADDVNRAMGLPLLPTGSLWNENDAAVARRLSWPRESATSTSSSFRAYPNPPLPVLGRDAYTMVLHGEDGKPISLSWIFANKGDVDRMMNLGPETRDSDRQRALRDYARFIRDDERALTESLTALFGAPSTLFMGDSRQLQERVRRWDWTGHTFLLAAPGSEYVSLRMVPTDTLDAAGIERVTRRDLQARLTARIERRANGDVILTDMPMVDQGPKGYCVPATWERVLRYMGIPADMYVLAMAADTRVGGGTSLRGIQAGVQTTVQRYGRRIGSQRSRLTVQTVARYIDQGVPIVWTMYALPEIDQTISQRTRQRRAVTDWKAWENSLQSARREARRIRQDPAWLHQCMIIGYNRATGEVAISDSWGPAFAERWMTFEEAEAVSHGEFTIVQP